MADTALFTRLRRLFSSDVVVRNIGGNQLRVIDSDRIQSNPNIATNSLTDRFTRLYQTNNTSVSNPLLNYQTLRIQLYSDYEVMDTDAIVASALDIVADESTLKNERGEVLHIQSPDENIQKILYNLFYDVLNIEFNLWSWVRSMCKYGDFYLKLDIAEKYGVYNVKPYSAYDIVREEGTDKDNPSYVRFKHAPGSLGSYSYTESNELIFENYEVAHFRLLSDHNFNPYGRSYLEPGRKTYKQMTLMEDAALVHRIMRAPEKRIYYINVGNIPPAEVESFMQKTINKMKKVPYVNPDTGDYNLKFNMQNMLEDFYIPVRGNDQSTKIDTTKGLEYNGMEDVVYLRDKLFAALKVPKAFLGYDKDLQGKCLDPNTIIPLLDGRSLSIKDLIIEFNNGVKNYVYSLDETTKNIVPGEIEWTGYTRMNAQVLKVWLDNGENIICTPDHKFMTRDGEWKEAQDLIENESLMPLYLRQSTDKKINGYTEVYNPSTGKFEYVHRLVADKKEGKVIHHKDCNKLNNNPENLDCSMDFWEHRQWHIDHTRLCHTPEANEKRNKTITKLLSDPNSSYYKMRQETGKKGGEVLKQWIKENGASRKGYIKNPVGECKGCGCIIDKTLLGLHKRNNEYCSKECLKTNWVSKYKSISKNTLLQQASECVNFKELKNKLSIKDHATLRKVINYNGFESAEFIIKHMPKAHNNAMFMNQFPETNEYYIENFHPEHKQWKEKYSYKNHKVSRIEWINETMDTCDLTIKTHHNFGTSAGVIVHNSTLAAEDIRFARTVERIQRIMLSELTKIALVHLYTQGFTGSSLVNFELSLTTPSIIYDQERTALFKEKAELALTLMDNDILPSDWVYENIFHFSEDEYNGYRNQLLEDSKRKFRLGQIENEGNDPVESGKSYGTPHDLASLYGKGRYSSDEVPTGYDEKQDVGRPQERATNRNTQDDNFGKDRLGTAGMKDTKIDKSINQQTKGSALALESSRLIKQMEKVGSLTPKKQIIYEGKQTEEKNTLLDEKNIRGLE